MTANGASALIVDLGSSIGIVTNSDLRSRVVAEGLSGRRARVLGDDGSAFT